MWEAVPRCGQPRENQRFDGAGPRVNLDRLSGLIHGLLGAFFPPLPERLDEVEPGRVAVVRGRVVPRDLMKSPLSGIECVYYRYTVEEWRRSSIGALGGDGFWQIADRDEAIVEFYLHDADRRAVVSPFSAQVEARRGVAARRVDLGMADRRATEIAIVPGDWIEVVARSIGWTTCSTTGATTADRSAGSACGLQPAVR